MLSAQCQFPFSWPIRRLWQHWLPGELPPRWRRLRSSPLSTRTWRWWVVWCWRLHIPLGGLGFHFLPSPIPYITLDSVSFFFPLPDTLFPNSHLFLSPRSPLLDPSFFFTSSPSFPTGWSSVSVSSLHFPSTPPIGSLSNKPYLSLTATHMVGSHTIPPAPWICLDPQFPGMLCVLDTFIGQAPTTASDHDAPGWPMIPSIIPPVPAFL